MPNALQISKSLPGAPISRRIHIVPALGRFGITLFTATTYCALEMYSRHCFCLELVSAIAIYCLALILVARSISSILLWISWPNKFFERTMNGLAGIAFLLCLALTPIGNYLFNITPLAITEPVWILGAVFIFDIFTSIRRQRKRALAIQAQSEKSAV